MPNSDSDSDRDSDDIEPLDMDDSIVEGHVPHAAVLIPIVIPENLYITPYLLKQKLEETMDSQDEENQDFVSDAIGKILLKADFFQDAQLKKQNKPYYRYNKRYAKPEKSIEQWSMESLSKLDYLLRENTEFIVDYNIDIVLLKEELTPVIRKSIAAMFEYRQKFSDMLIEHESFIKDSGGSLLKRAIPEPCKNNQLSADQVALFNGIVDKPLAGIALDTPLIEHEAQDWYQYTKQFFMKKGLNKPFLTTHQLYSPSEAPLNNPYSRLFDGFNYSRADTKVGSYLSSNCFLDTSEGKLLRESIALGYLRDYIINDATEGVSAPLVIHPVNFNTKTFESVLHFRAQPPGLFPMDMLLKLYNSFIPNDGSRVLVGDPCMGWFNRAVALALLAHQRQQSIDYFGTDPQYKESSYKNAADGIINYFTSRGDSPITFEPHANGAEDPDLFKDFAPGRSFQLIFTSPPYYSTERYPGKNQSYLEYPHPKKWSEKFLAVMFRQFWEKLQYNGKWVLNYSAPTAMPKFSTDKILDVFFTTLGLHIPNLSQYLTQLHFMQSGKSGASHKNGKNNRYEVIMVFEKMALIPQAIAPVANHMQMEIVEDKCSDLKYIRSKRRLDDDVISVPSEKKSKIEPAPVAMRLTATEMGLFTPKKAPQIKDETPEFSLEDARVPPSLNLN